MKNSVVSTLGAEALGTLFFVFLGASAVIAVGAGLGSGLAWALALIVAVWAFSAGGGHLNPFVTIALALRGKFSWAAVPGHVIAQLVGGLLGGLLLWWLYNTTLGADGAAAAATHTAATGADLIGVIVAEALATFVLLAVVFRLIHKGGAIYGLGYGLAYGIGVLAIGMISGASMNFARTLGAELTLTIAGSESADWGNIWIYLVGPLVGVVLAWLVYPLVSGAPKEKEAAS
jgi:glycerol uptake facilitator-like aquaporin